MKTNMNILIISQDIPPNIGGIAAHVKELSDGLIKLGNNVAIVSYYNDGNIFSNKIKPDKIGKVDVYNLPVALKPYLRRAEVKLKLVPILMDIYRSGHYDLVHWHTLGLDSVFASYLTGIPRVFTNHSSTFLYMVKNKQQNILKKQIGFADAVISPSMELKRETENIGFPSSKSFYIPNGVDKNKFSRNLERRASKRKELGIEEGTIAILCPRRLVIKNGVRYAVESMKYMTNIRAKLFVAGDVPVNDSGEEKREIDKIISENKLTKAVVFLGNVPNDQMPDVIDASDIVVIPSLMEATSIAALEAMAMSKPVVASNVGGLPELIDDNIDGLLTKPGDSQSIAEALLLLCNDSNLRNKSGSNAQRKVYKNFTQDIIANKTLDVYRGVL